MELSGYLAVAKRWWWTLLVATWVAAISGYVVASSIPPTYEAETQLLVGPYNTDVDTLRAAGNLVQTYADLVTTTPLLDSAIKVIYTPRGSFRGVARQYYEYGRWKVSVMRKHRRVISARSLAPPIFVGSLVVLSAAAAVSPVARLLLAAEVAAYGAAAGALGARSLRRRQEPWRMLPLVVGVFPTFHVSYGVDLIDGLIRAPRSG